MSLIKKIYCILFIPKVVILIGGSVGSLRMFLERLSNKSCYEFNSYFTQALREIHCASEEWIINSFDVQLNEIDSSSQSVLGEAVTANWLPI